MNVVQLTAGTSHADVVVEQSAMTENVQILKRKEIPVEDRKKLRVAAYCRVSTDKEEQESSIDIQMKSYRKIIEEHPDWELAGIYADPGKTGTSVKHRKDFLRMIEDAKAGRINIIIAKSISRFARNTADMLKYTRMLRDIGVAVIFEKENIKTLSSTSEMLLTIYAAFSQEESHDISEWERHGVRNDAARGVTRFACVYGYTSKGKEKWIIVPEEAEIVRRIFDSYNKGKSMIEIGNDLNNDGLRTRKGKMWNSTNVRSILQNEKYIGDYRFQKSYVADFLTHKSVSNKDMKIPQYYITDDHEPIVSREAFQDAQIISYMRDDRRGSLQYPYYGFLICPECGTPLVSFSLPMQTSPKCWVCPGHKEGIKQKKRSDCRPFAFYERVLNEAVGRAILGLDTMDGVTKKELETIQRGIRKTGKIEYYHLKTLVEKITFPDYEHITVCWKNGKTTTLALKFSGYYTHPYPEVGRKNGDCFEYGGEELTYARLLKAQKSMETRACHIGNLEIIMPKEDEKIQIPIVNRGAGHGNHKNRKNRKEKK